MVALVVIHNHPVSGKWNLADDYTKYAHSIAAYYDLGQHHELVALPIKGIIVP